MQHVCGILVHEPLQEVGEMLTISEKIIIPKCIWHVDRHVGTRCYIFVQSRNNRGVFRKSTVSKATIAKIKNLYTLHNGCFPHDIWIAQHAWIFSTTGTPSYVKKVRFLLLTSRVVQEK